MADTRLALLSAIRAFAADRGLPITAAEQFYMQDARDGLRPDDVYLI